MLALLSSINLDPTNPNNHRYYGFGVADGGVAVPPESGVGWIRYQVPQSMQHRFYTGTVSATVSNERFRIAADGKVSLGAGCSLEALEDLTIGASTSVVNIGTSSAAQTVNIGTGTGQTTINVGGNITCSTAPTMAGHLANKAYVDTKSTEQFQSWTTTFTGPTGTTPTIKFNLSRQGRVVTITNTQVFTTNATLPMNYFSNDNVPAEFRTYGGYTCPIFIYNGSNVNREIGIAGILNNGQVYIKTLNGAFSGSGHTGWEKWSMSFIHTTDAY